KTVDLQPYTKERPYWIRSHRFILTESEEIFSMPIHLSGDFKLKSSAGRHGYQHVLAGYCDPGWTGSRLTKELTNIRQWRAIPIYPGMRLGQLVFQYLMGIPERSYAETGRYNNDLQVQESKGL
ncbi:MAG: dCTP deaminase domain-containing protein, partial [Sphaerospermopsis kisseleviana]